MWAILQSVAAAGDTFTYPTDLTEQAGRALWVSATARSQTLIATDECDAVLGSAKLGPNHGGPGAHVATASFIVASPARGRGVGRALLRAALNWARTHDFEAMQFNAVAASNVAAIELYRSEGFQVVGSIPEAFRHPVLGDVALLVMHIKLFDHSAVW